MLKIWGRLSSVNVQKVVWTVRELALPYTRIDAGGQFGIVDTPDYAALNPNRQIPLIDVRYLSSRYGQGELWSDDPRHRADADRWMDWQATEWQPSMVRAFLGLIRTPPEQRDNAAIQASIDRAAALALLLENHLQDR